MTSEITFWDDKRHIVFVLELIFYSGLLLTAVAALSRRRHMGKSLTLGAIAVLKISGVGISVHAATQTVDAVNSQDASKLPSTGIVTAGAILVSLASAPLIMLTRAFCPPDDLPDQLQRGARTIMLLPAILSIVGYNLWANQDPSTDTGIAMAKASSILYLAVYLLFVIFGLYRYSQLHGRATRVLTTGTCTVLLAMPFLIVRFVFIIISSFALDSDMTAYHKFSFFNGDWRASLSMFVVMEFMVELIYSVGLHLLITREWQHDRLTDAESFKREEI
ncbi:LAME_0F05974g1_1 [Lachancea meyersii CBS 8951]|uniref:LAME_0F05974g1_1 n=1 Tax=Lachancea meyersii CBS 8951 TaxID=1266667 RepID=A0A1G4JT40_9SACH|nr:LAME_0F05974g1_1 [Lachancea meyersii CBS 8951]